MRVKVADSLRFVRSIGRHALALLTSPGVTHLMGEPFFWLLGMRRKGGEVDLSQVKRVLVVRLDEIGDVVMTGPFLRELRRNLRDAWITLVVKPAVYNLVELCPYVNEVLTYDWRVNGRFTNLRRQWRALRLAWRHLWRRRFDLAILPRWDTDGYHGTFVLYFSGAPWRVSYSESVIDHKRRANNGFDRLLTHPLNDSNLKHEVEHNLDVIRYLSGQIQDDRLELWLSDEDEAFAEGILKQNGVQPGEVVVGFGPSGGNSRLKQWPLSSFVELGRWLQRKYGARIIVVGGRGEEPLGREIERGVGSSVVDAVGKTTLRQMATLLKRCHVYVGNDAGPMHVAAGVGVPVVALFGSSCHHRFGPWGKERAVLWLAVPCTPCFQAQHLDRCGRCVFDQPHCILGITVEQVEQAVIERLLRRGVKPCIKESNSKFTIPIRYDQALPNP